MERRRIALMGESIWTRCAKDLPGKDLERRDDRHGMQDRPSVCKSGPSSGLEAKRDQLFG
jgi:hypothetical protein